MKSYIGIDLGTTHSLIGVWDEQGVTLIPNSLGKFLTPSAVSVDSQNNILIGEAAFERLVTHSHFSATEFKRFMGTSKQYQLGDHFFSPEDLSALVLRQLKQDAENHLGTSINEAVISVPAYFNNRQRRATQRAAELAGLKVERLINEPSAAALAYGLEKQESIDNDDPQSYLVLDLGGGTFDVSLLEIFNGIFEIRASSGDNYLGGNDFTRVIVEDFCKQQSLSYGALAPGIKGALFAAADTLKRELSEANSATLSLKIEEKFIDYTLSDSRFTVLVEELLNRVRHPISRTMNDAELRSSELAGVILVGGASRMPVFRSSIARMLGRIPSSNFDPDFAIASGACIQAGLKARDSSLQDIVMVDVCPYTLGVGVINEQNQYEFQPIIERNQAIPVSESCSVYTRYPHQESIVIKVYQGESFKPSDNVELGELLMDITPSSNIQEIVLTYTYDINGVLEVEVRIPETNEQQTLYISDDETTLSDEQLKERFAELQELKILPRDDAKNTLLIATLERFFEQSLGEQREFYAQLLRDFKGVINSHNKQNVDERREEINKLIHAS